MASRRVILAAGERLLSSSSRKSLQSSTNLLACAPFSTSSRRDKNYELLVVGGGTAGAAIANKFAPRLGKSNIAVIEPHDVHYYQPMWTMVGAGLKRFEQSGRQESDVLPKDCTWIQDKVQTFDPDNNAVTTEKGDKITYDFLIVATGLHLDYAKIEGLMDALEHDPFVCSNYSPLYVEKTWHSLQHIEKGNAIFTFPNTPIKCAGAPQKICYLAEDYFKRKGKRDQINVMYNTSLGVIFGIPKYAAVLSEICKNRNITVNKRRNLVKVDHTKKVATFEDLDSTTGETHDFEYSMLHVAPPMSTQKALWDTPLVDETKYLTVNRDTLQHTKYPNIFGMGDNTNAPTAKTAAAVAAQVGIVNTNLTQVMKGGVPTRVYDGYTSCPLLTSNKSCIMAEFGYDGRILETFPINQAKERFTMFLMKKEFMPQLYWYMLVKGRWHGPEYYRKLMRLGIPLKHDK